MLWLGPQRDSEVPGVEQRARSWFLLPFKRNAKEGPGDGRPPPRREPTYPGGWLGRRPPAAAAEPGAAGGRRLRAGPACWLFLQPRAKATQPRLAVPCGVRSPSGPAGGAGGGSARRVRGAASRAAVGGDASVRTPRGAECARGSAERRPPGSLWSGRPGPGEGRGRGGPLGGEAGLPGREGAAGAGSVGGGGKGPGAGWGSRPGRAEPGLGAVSGRCPARRFGGAGSRGCDRRTGRGRGERKGEQSDPVPLALGTVSPATSSTPFVF